MTYIRKLLGMASLNEGDQLPLELNETDFIAIPQEVEPQPVKTMLEKNVEITQNLVGIHQRRVKDLTESIRQMTEELRQASVSLSAFERAYADLMDNLKAGAAAAPRSDAGTNVKMIHSDIRTGKMYERNE